MAGLFYFGTRDYAQWVPAPAVNMDASKVGYSNTVQYLNGGAWTRGSVASHKEYQMTWNLTSRDKIRQITDYADGIYGLGPIYWADPMNMDKNALPAYWAAPFMAVNDGPILDGASIRPTALATTTNSLGYPITSAVFTVGTVVSRPSVYLPIPPGYTAWVGAHGIAGTGGVVVATPSTGPSTTGTAVNLTMLSVTTTTRVNQSFAGNTYPGVLISLGGTGTVTLAGLIVQILPDAATPQLGGFISGQGHGGAQFAAQPVLTEYSSVYDLAGLTAKLVETSAWL